MVGIMRQIFVSILLLISINLFAQEESEKSYYVRRGIAFMEEADYITAISCFERAINESKEDSDAYYNRGNIYFYLKQYEKAIEDYSALLSLDSRKPYQIMELYRNRGKAYRFIQKYDEAIIDFTKLIIYIEPITNISRALKTDGDEDTFGELNFEAYFFRALTYQDIKEYKNSILDYSNALKFNIDSSDAYNNRGNSYLLIHDYNNAINDYLKAIDLGSKYFWTYYSLAECYAANKDYFNASIHFSNSINLNMNHSEAYIKRGLCYWNMNNFHGAIGDIEKAIRLDPVNEKYKEILEACKSDFKFKSFDGL
jgi:tetratricopeptide (TPR) repeat protein